MKADERHQLKQNELAEALGKLRDWNSPSTRYTVLGVVVLLALFGGYKGWRYMQRHTLEQAWQRLTEIESAMRDPDPTKAAGALDNLRTLIRDASNPAVAATARLELARARYDEGLEKPEQRQAAFAEAADLLKQVADNRDSPAELAAAATFGLATTYESLRQLARAGELYDSLVKNPRFKGSPFLLLAMDRQKKLDELATPVEFTPGDPPAPPPPEPVATAPTTMPTTAPTTSPTLPASAPASAPVPASPAAPTPPASQPAPPPASGPAPPAPVAGAGQSP